MKTITTFLIAITICFNAFSQNIDTVLVRNLTLRADHWAYLVGSYDNTKDSVTMTAYHRIRNKVQTLLPLAWATNVTIDSLPGRVVVEFYEIIKGSEAGVIVTIYTAMTNAIIAKTNLQTWLTEVDNRKAADFIRRRDRGKNLIVDKPGNGN